MKNIRMVALLALPVTPLLELFERYVFGDWEFVRWLVVLMCLDTFLGFVKHWYRRDVSSKAWGMIVKKLIVYSCVLVLSHVMSNFAIVGNAVESFIWFRYFACSALMVREALSIIENVEEICPGFFPKAIITKLREFDSINGNKLEKE